MKHEPSRFLSDTESAGNLIGRNTIAAIGDHPECAEPFIQCNGGIFHHSSDLHRELPFRVLRCAFPQATSSNEANFLAATGRANNAIRPTALCDVTQAVVRIGEVLDCCLEAFGFVVLCHNKSITAQT